MGFDKWIQHYSITQNNFTALKIPCAPPIVHRFLKKILDLSDFLLHVLLESRSYTVSLPTPCPSPPHSKKQVRLVPHWQPQKRWPGYAQPLKSVWPQGGPWGTERLFAWSSSDAVMGDSHPQSQLRGSWSDSTQLIYMLVSLFVESNRNPTQTNLSSRRNLSTTPWTGLRAGPVPGKLSVVSGT